VRYKTKTGEVRSANRCTNLISFFAATFLFFRSSLSVLDVGNTRHHQTSHFLLAPVAKLAKILPPRIRLVESKPATKEAGTRISLIATAMGANSREIHGH
jgi:hypothetical protein